MIHVPFSDTMLQGSVIQVTGDNLALHGLLVWLSRSMQPTVAGFA